MSDEKTTGARPTRRGFMKTASGALAAGALAGAGAFYILKRRRPNVVFIISDAVRADKIGAAGPSGRSLTPFLDSAAARGALFEKCVSPSSWTLPSVAGMVSSRNPIVTGEYYSESFAAGATTFAAELQRDGYFTFAVVKNPWLPAVNAKKELMPSIVTTGFERYDLGGVRLEENPLHAKGMGAPREVRAFAPAEEATDEAAEVIDAMRSAGGRRPFLLYLHYMNTHQPYSPSPRQMAIADATAPPVEGIPDHLLYQVLSARGRGRGFTTPLPAGDLPLLARAEALYDAALASVDAAVERLAERIREAGELENTVFIFTSDHGEEFGERGRCGHSVTLYQECIHVPLVVWGRGVGRGRRIGGLIRGIDFAPGIIEMAGSPAVADFAGAGFGLARDVPRPKEAAACTVAPTLPRKLETVTLAILEDGGAKFITKRPAAGGQGEAQRELYDLESDPDELVDMAGRASLERFDVRVNRYWAAAAARPEAARLALESETEEALRSIGYMN